TGDNPSVEGRGFAGITERPAAKPLIAAVEGYALAGGCEVALACDMIVAAKDAQFGLPEPKRGLVAGAGGLLRLPNRIPYHIAMEIALTGDRYPAERMAELGFVNRLTESGGALAAAKELALQVAENAPLALAATKRVIVESADWSSAEAWKKQQEIIMPVCASKDAQEARRPSPRSASRTGRASSPPRPGRSVKDARNQMVPGVLPCVTQVSGASFSGLMDGSTYLSVSVAVLFGPRHAVILGVGT